MTRPHFSRKERARLFQLRSGICGLCKGKVDASREAWEIEHEIPWEISRDNSDDNLQVAHVKCHLLKTADDRRDIAKVHRMEAKHNGTFPKPRGNARLQSRGFSATRHFQPAQGATDDSE